MTISDSLVKWLNPIQWKNYYKLRESSCIRLSLWTFDKVTFESLAMSAGTQTWVLCRSSLCS